MQMKPNLPPSAAELRRRAKERLREQRPEPGQDRTDAGTQHQRNGAEERRQGRH